MNNIVFSFLHATVLLILIVEIVPTAGFLSTSKFVDGTVLVSIPEIGSVPGGSTDGELNLDCISDREIQRKQPLHRKVRSKRLATKLCAKRKGTPDTGAPIAENPDPFSLNPLERKFFVSQTISNDILPSPPSDKIEARALLTQTRELLTVKELKDLLKTCQLKVSGNKRELVDRLGEALVSKEKRNSSSLNCVDKGETKNAVKVKVAKNVDTSLKQLRNKRTESNVDGDTVNASPSGYCDPMGWSVIEPSLRIISDSSSTNSAHSPMDRIYNSPHSNFDSELPLLSGLLFVNKPSGMSTLPTKQQLDMQQSNNEMRDGSGPMNSSTPAYPCLSDSVKEWLNNHPDGRERLEIAQREEEQWWEFTLQHSHEEVSKGKKYNEIHRKNKKQFKKKQQQFKKIQSKLSSFEPRPVHRLDIDTSGIVCVALTPLALRAASMLFEQKSLGSLDGATATKTEEKGVEKQYVALVEGSLGNAYVSEKVFNGHNENKAGTISHAVGKIWVPHINGSSNIAKVSENNFGRSADGHHEWACDIFDDGSVAFCRPGDESREDPLRFVSGSLRDAVTSYQAVEWSGSNTDSVVIENVTRVELTPLTGRGHQLRLHMSSIGHPIVGDDMHGKVCRRTTEKENNLIERNLVEKNFINSGRLCLHASKLSMDGLCLSNPQKGSGFKKCRILVESFPPF